MKFLQILITKIKGVFSNGTDFRSSDRGREPTFRWERRDYLKRIYDAPGKPRVLTSGRAVGKSEWPDRRQRAVIMLGDVHDGGSLVKRELERNGKLSSPSEDLERFRREYLGSFPDDGGAKPRKKKPPR
jgi:hypothetical protein